MFDISVLKEMKLSELQEIAKAAKTIKFTGVKKEALISQILELQSATTVSSKDNKTVEDKSEDDKPKRARIIAPKKAAIQKSSNNSLFSEQEIAFEPSVAEVITDTVAEVGSEKKERRAGACRQVLRAHAGKYWRIVRKGGS